jgi:Fe-S-cluster containining protein
VGEEAARFEELYVRKVGARKSLREREDGDCVLLDAQKRTCTVYAARPRQCRTWPFWDSNLKAPDDWAHTCQVCPGSGKGQLYQLQQIEEQRSVIKV